MHTHTRTAHNEGDISETQPVCANTVLLGCFSHEVRTGTSTVWVLQALSNAERFASLPSPDVSRSHGAEHQAAGRSISRRRHRTVERASSVYCPGLLLSQSLLSGVVT